MSDSISPTAELAKFPGSELVPNPHRFLTPEGPGAATTTPALECEMVSVTQRSGPKRVSEGTGHQEPSLPPPPPAAAKPFAVQGCF